ncbi:MAG: F0F1 ATP synthase subunit A [Planctomycetota bacterium]|jgi:F-type H+-transporting ATPase subunit a|nr:F0F1 ATP synthase subunit A [Planctomycetota bacterium]
MTNRPPAKPWKLAAALAAGLLPGSGQAWAGLENPPPLEFLGLEFNHATVVHSALAAAGVYVLVRLFTLNLSRERPRRGQVVMEMLVSLLLGLVKQTIGPNRGPKYLPWIGTLFLFIWAANLLSLFPVDNHHFGGEFFNDYNGNGLYDPGEPFIDTNGDGIHNPGFQLPRLEEPTSDLSFPLTLAVLFVVVIGHGSGLRFRGLSGYLKEYLTPGGIIGVAMLPLNLVGKISELISLSFRIFGNIFGGAIIMSVMSGLVLYFLIPIGMYGYFGVFCGSIQAFVFTMLAATYISMEAAEEAGD